MPFLLRCLLLSFVALLTVALLPACQLLSGAAGPALVGTRWQVVEMNGEALPLQPPFTLLLLQDGHIRAWGGCRELVGDYQHQGRVLRIGPLALTHEDCGAAVMQREKEMIRAMEGASSWQIEGDTLSLFNPIDIALVRFQPAPAPAAP